MLRTVTWGVLRGMVPRDPHPRLVEDLAERLALVAAVVTAAALEGVAPGPSGGRAGPPAAPVRSDDPPYVLHDARVPARDAWLRSVDFALARHGRTDEPFALLLADLDDVERLVAAEVGRSWPARSSASSAPCAMRWVSTTRSCASGSAGTGS